MQISLSALGQAAGYAQLKQQREAAEALAAKRRDQVKAGAGKALSSGRLGAVESSKEMARAKIEAIRERLKVIKQLFGANPLGMAKALAQIFKELKSAVRDFRDLTKQEMDLSGDGVRAALDEDVQEPAEPAGEEKADADSGAKPDPQSSAPAASPKGLYGETVQATRELIGKEGFEIIDEVKGVAKKAQELLEAARTQARARKKDDETDKAFEEADKSLKALNRQMDAMAEDIRHAAPGAGMRLSVAA